MTNSEIRDTRPTQSHSISPIGWVALAGVCGIALLETVKEPPISPTLESFASGQVVVVRMTERTLNFPVLGARVDLPEGWVHLSTTSPSLATKPVFVNKTTQSIVALGSAYEILQDPSERKTKRFNFDGGTIDWFTAPGADRSISTTAYGVNLPSSWLGQGDHHAGLLKINGATVELMVFPPTDAAEKSILEFCRSVEPIPAD